MNSKQYDYKQAYNKKLKPSAQLHYLENARHDADTPNKMVGVASGMMQNQMTNVPPAPSSLKDPFNPQAQATAAGLFGNQQALQNSVNAPALFKAPLQSREHPGKDGHTGHVKDPKGGGEVVKVYDDSKPKRKLPKEDKGTPRQQKNKKVANLLNARSSKELNK